MIDAAIESHLRTVISGVYPDIKSSEIIVQFQQGSLEISDLPNILYNETTNINLIITTASKIDRHDIIRALTPDYIKLNGEYYDQMVTGFRQGNYIEAAKHKSLIIELQYKFDILTEEN